MARTRRDVGRTVVVFERLHLEEVSRHVATHRRQQHLLRVVRKSQPTRRLVVGQRLRPLHELLAPATSNTDVTRHQNKVQLGKRHKPDAVRHVYLLGILTDQREVTFERFLVEHLRDE